jgi:hypothetical protein
MTLLTPKTTYIDSKMAPNITYAVSNIKDTVSPHTPQWKTWLPFVAISILLAVIYHRVAVKLVYDWRTISDYTHGPFVPLFSLFLLWDKRKTLRTIPIRQSWAGILLVVFSLILLYAAASTFRVVVTSIASCALACFIVRFLKGPLTSP